MDTAFHSLMENLETLNLNEGEYLQMTNLLKKAYDDSKSKTGLPKKEPFLGKFVLHGEKTIVVETIDTYTNRDDGEHGTLWMTYKVDGVSYTKRKCELRYLIAFLYRINLTETITMERYGVSFTRTLKELSDAAKKERADTETIDEDDDPDYCIEHLLVDRFFL